jgi:shikimate kinase
MERVATERLVTAPAAIVATGGGWVTAPDTVALIRPVGRITYLRVTPETAVKRLRDAYQARPLLAGDPARAVERLHAERRAAYEASDHVIDTEALTEQEVTAMVVRLARAADAG